MPAKGIGRNFVTRPGSTLCFAFATALATLFGGWGLGLVTLLLWFVFEEAVLPINAPTKSVEESAGLRVFTLTLTTALILLVVAEETIFALHTTFRRVEESAWPLGFVPGLSAVPFGLSRSSAAASPAAPLALASAVTFPRVSCGLLSWVGAAIMGITRPFATGVR